MREGERSAPIFWPISLLCLTRIFFGCVNFGPCHLLQNPTILHFRSQASWADFNLRTLSAILSTTPAKKRSNDRKPCVKLS